MSPRYSDVFRSHRVLFLLPVVLAGAIALWVSLSAPKMYRSQATLWSDNAASASTVFGALPPAGQDQQLLAELLTTHYFQNAVANQSPLGRYLRTHRDSGWGPAALLARVRSRKTLDQRIATALGSTRVTSSTKGPHVLDVSYDAPTPSLAVATLRVILRDFARQRGALRQDAFAASEQQVIAASKALGDARKSLTQYLNAHPSSTRSDPQLSALAVAERNAVTQLANATENVNQASLSVSSGAASQTTLRIVDAPLTPIGPTAGKARLVKALAAGLFAGVIVSILGIIALTRYRRSRTGGTGGDSPGVVADAPFAERGARLERAE